MTPQHIRTALLVTMNLAAGAEPALTIYNQNFAVVRDVVPLELTAGYNRVQYDGATVYVEPDSVTLRDASGKAAIHIVEQSYRADPVSMRALLSQYEGRTIDFVVRSGDRTEVVTGKVIRAPSGALLPSVQYGWAPYQPPQPEQPIVEVDGKLRFELPGVPLFPALSSDSILKPVLDWTIYSATAARLQAELAYITAGLNWEAAYNIVQSASGPLEITAWVTIHNLTGKLFENAQVKLMAGDLNKIVRPELLMQSVRIGGAIGGIAGGIPGGLPTVTEKSFDQYHLYTLPSAVTLHNSESKQVQFLRAENIRSETIYVYDGLKIDRERFRTMPAEVVRTDSSIGAQSTKKVWVMREFENSKASGLGMPLPKGRTRFYRRDSDGQMEFTGEDNIDHTPEGERLRVFTGAAFDLVGERRRTSYRIDHARSTADEAFEIRVRNRKKEAAEVRVVEHLFRWNTWEIPTTSVPFTKRDSDTIEFRVPLQPGEEKSVSYLVRYTW